MHRSTPRSQTPQRRIQRAKPARPSALGWLSALLGSCALFFGSGCQRLPAKAQKAGAPPPSAQQASEPASNAPSASSLASTGSAGPASPTDLATLSSVPFLGGEQAFRAVKDTLRSKYYRAGLTEEELYRAATAGMLQLLEPQLSAWNKLMSPEELRELQADMQGSIVGIGVEIRFDADSGISDVLSVIPGSPAERAGMRDGDKILTVGGKLYKGKSLRDVVGDLRGKPGEVVSLTALRGADVLTLSIRRERVAYDLVQPIVFPDGIGYLFIRQFTEGTPAAIEQALRDLAQKQTRALVVDLRGNQGGLFEKAIATAELFLPKGTPVTKLRHRGGQIETIAAQKSGDKVKWPLALLVDRETASSAELLAGALHDGAGAHLVGARTYGKGTVQRLEELPNGYAYKFTASHFLLPRGDVIEGQGLMPDIEVALSVPDGRTYERQLSRVLHTSDLQERLRLDAPLRAAAHVLRLTLR